MKRKFLFLALPFFLFAAPFAQAGGKTDPPALLVQVRSAERVLDHVKLILTLIERPDIAEKVEAMLKAKIGAEGLAGVDLKRPLGVSVRFLNAAGDIVIEPLILVPISDEKAFLKLLETNKVKVIRDKKDVFKAEIPGDVPLEFHFRFAKGYLHGTILTETAIEDKQLVDPAKLLGGADGPTFALTARLDQVPEGARLIALGEFDKVLRNLMKEAGGLDKELQAFQAATLETVGQTVKSVLMEGEELKFTLDVDAKKKRLVANASLTGKSGSGLAKAIDELGKQPSKFAGLVSDKAMFNGLINVKMPDKLTKALSDFFAAMKAKATAELTDKAKQLQAKALFEVLEPTFKQGAIDAYVAMEVKDKHLDYLVALGVKEGKKLEATLRGFVEEIKKAMPEKDRDRIKLDFAKAGGVSVHRFEIPPTRELAPLTELVGEPTAYFAFLDDAVFVSLGKGGLESIQKGVGGAKASKAPLLLYRADMGKLMPLMAGKGVALPEKLFPPGGDNTLLFRIDGGAALTARVELPLDIFLMAGVKK